MNPKFPGGNMADYKIILGSSSKPRQEVLKEMGYDFVVMSADIDERAIRMNDPENLVMALAEAKAQAILSRPIHAPEQPLLLITADQVVVNEGVIREKPVNEQEAREFIAGYSRAPAVTVSGVLVTNVKTGKKKGGIDKAEIYFHPIPEPVIDDLIREGSVFYAAGGLLVEHPMVSPLVQSMVGSIDSVMGLPKELTQSLIRDALNEAS